MYGKLVSCHTGSKGCHVYPKVLMASRGRASGLPVGVRGFSRVRSLVAALDVRPLIEVAQMSPVPTRLAVRRLRTKL